MNYDTEKLFLKKHQKEKKNNTKRGGEIKE